MHYTELCKEPTPEALAKITGLSTQQISELLRALAEKGLRPASIEAALRLFDNLRFYANAGPAVRYPADESMTIVGEPAEDTPETVVLQIQRYDPKP